MRNRDWMALLDQCKDKANLSFFIKRFALIITWDGNGRCQAKTIFGKEDYKF